MAMIGKRLADRSLGAAYLLAAQAASAGRGKIEDSE
jgi:hypothetical protein